jgi:hypothetical protein
MSNNTDYVKLAAFGVVRSVDTAVELETERELRIKAERERDAAYQQGRTDLLKEQAELRVSMETDLDRIAKRTWTGDDNAALEYLQRLAEGHTHGYVSLHAQLTAEREARKNVERERDALLTWQDEDLPLPEDSDMEAALPMRTGDHARFEEAVRLVGAKRSKAALVLLVNWLLKERDEQASKRDERDRVVQDLLCKEEHYQAEITRLESERDEARAKWLKNLLR